MGSTNSSANSVRESIQAMEIKDDDTFFGRKEELTKLAFLLAGSPEKITLIVGPKSSGITALLSRLQYLWEQDPGRQAMAPLVLINMRMEDCSTPATLAATIKAQVSSWKDRCVSALQALGGNNLLEGYSVADVLKAVRAFWDNELAASSSLPAIQATIQAHCSRYKQLVRPVIIIDQSNMLMDWEQGGYSAELKNFVRFLEGLTKEKQLAHVVLASSDEFFRPWLTRKVLTDHLKILGLGYFSEANAKELFTSGCKSRNIDLPADWETAWWPRIYSITGGSPLHLTTILNEVDQDPLSAADSLVEMESIVLSIVLGSAWIPDAAGDVCTASDFKTVMKAIVDSGGAVKLQQIYAKYNADEEAKVCSIIRYLVRINAVHVRLVTRTMTYKDIPSGSPYGEYIMAVTPTSLAAMKTLA